MGSNRKDKMSEKMDRILNAALKKNYNEENLLNKVDGKQFIEVDIKLIKPNPLNPRKKIPTRSVLELAASIKNDGLLNPPMVMHKNGEYILIHGERRFEAMKALEKTSMPVILCEAESDENIFIKAIVENLQRADLSERDKASAIVDMRNKYHLSHVEIANKLGFSLNRIIQLVNVMKLPDNVLDTLDELGYTTSDYYIALYMAMQKGFLDILMWEIKSKKLSGKETLKFAKIHIQNKKINPVSRSTEDTTKALNSITKKWTTYDIKTKQEIIINLEELIKKMTDVKNDLEKKMKESNKIVSLVP